MRVRSGPYFYCFLLIVIAINGACNVSPGRPAVYDDAQVAGQSSDSGLVWDAAAMTPELGVRDTGPGLLDAGPKPAFAFTGVWSIFDQASVLYAREVDLSLNLIIGGFPYVYTGTISVDGDFELQGNSLIRSGCSSARLTGNFNRSSSFYTLRHTSCNGQGEVFETDLRGSFQSSFTPSRSGIYRLSGTVVTDLQACYTGRPGPYELIYGVSLDPNSGNLAIFTAKDIIEQPMVYLGSYSASDDAFSLQHTPFFGSMDGVTAFTGRFEQFGGNDPLRLVGQRDVIDPDTLCQFTMVVEGTKISGP